jgi:hypothetical protein
MTSTTVQKINIDLKEAKDKFNASTVNTNFTDFSDTITNRRKVGYRFGGPEDFDWNQDLVESPLNRFKRLEAELKRLKLDLKVLDTSKDENNKRNDITAASNADSNPADLLNNVDKLQKEIYNLHYESINNGINLTSLNTTATSTSTNNKKQLLLDHLAQMKTDLSLSKKDEDNLNGDSSIVFKIFADLDLNERQRLTKISELNARITKLENFFGVGNVSMSEKQINSLCKNVENKSILVIFFVINLKCLIKNKLI